MKKLVFLILAVFLTFSIVSAEKTCTDTEEGIDEFIWGSITASGQFITATYDSCEGGGFISENLRERYCDENNTVQTRNVSCANGCVDGVCRKTTGNNASTNIFICTDTESGKNYNRGGIVKHGWKAAGGTPSAFSADYCKDSTTLIETYCENGYYNEESYNCLTGCNTSSTSTCLPEGVCYQYAGCNPLEISCVENWECTEWGSCVNNQQTRNCSDSNNCGTVVNKPTTTQNCNSIPQNCTESWSCGSWSDCVNGQQTRTCTDANNCGTTNDKPPTTKSCARQQNRTRISRENITFVPWQKRNESECLEGCKCVGAVMSCPTETGKIMTIQAGRSGNIITITIVKNGNETEVNTTLELELEQEVNETTNKTKLRAKLSNGRKAEIKIMPDTASERAIERLGELNFTIELKEVGKGEETGLAYELKAEKRVRVLGFIQARMQVEAEVNAENGKIIRVGKPWWSFLASEE